MTGPQFHALFVGRSDAWVYLDGSAHKWEIDALQADAEDQGYEAMVYSFPSVASPWQVSDMLGSLLARLNGAMQ